MNKVILIGRLSKDIELRYTTTNKAVASTTIAVNRPKREDGSQETDFINLVVWGKLGENLHKYCGKGRQIAIEGRIQTRSYEDQNGQKRYVTEVIAENVQFLDTKKQENAQSEGKQCENTYQNAQKNQNIVQKSNSEIIKDVMEDKNPFEEFGNQIEFEDQDLPF